MSKIKNSHKFIFNRILFKNSIIRNFTRCESLKVNTIQCKAYHGINIYRPKIAQFATQNIPVETAVLRKQGVKNLNDLKRYIDEGKQFYIKLLTNILDKIEFANISNKDAILLLECCGNSVPDSSRQARNDVCLKVFSKILKHNTLDCDIYNTYIKICTENDILLKSDFLTSLKADPNPETYKLLLDNVCQQGNIEEAYKLLNLIKNEGLSVDEEIFNKLVLGYTVHDGLKGGESVLLTMRAARLPETENTKFSILKGVSKRKSFEDFENALLKYTMHITETQLLELVELLGLNENVGWLIKFRDVYGNIPISREFINALKSVCVHLVHMDKSECAMDIYKEFVKPAAEKNYAFFLLKEMLHYNVDINRIISVGKYLRDENLNDYALENLTYLALKHNYTEASWKLLQCLHELRPHFFWPLLLNAKKEKGETGIFEVLRTITDMNVKIDSDTLQDYVLPHYDLDFKFLVTKLQGLGLSVKEVLSPMLLVLLQNNKLKQASDLCSTYNVSISGDNFSTCLSTSWKSTNDENSAIFLLQRYCESNLTGNDLVGEFLIKAIGCCKTKRDFIHYLKLIKLTKENGLRMNSTSGDMLHNLCSTSCPSSEIAENIRDQIDSLINFQLKYETTLIPHPKYMNVDELECHLLELQEKGMETRGVLRKLIQMYSNLGNQRRVEELRQIFLDAGYEESVGMKSSLMYSYVKGGHLDAAIEMYRKIKNSNENFRLDEFKIIDLAALLVKNDRFTEAMDIFTTETKSRTVIGGSSVERNCWQLLGSFKDEGEQTQMFDFLIEKGYCKPTNVVLGPIVRIHLSKGVLQKAVDVYIKCANKHKCTPLQLELICAILKAKDEGLLRDVIKTTESIHGAISTQIVLIAALAENGQEHPLTKFLASNKIYNKDLLKQRCERWIMEGKVKPLMTLAIACERLPEVFDVSLVYNCIMQSFNLNNDAKGATEFYEKLLERDVPISKSLEDQLKRLKDSSQLKKKSAIF